MPPVTSEGRISKQAGRAVPGSGATAHFTVSAGPQQRKTSAIPRASHLLQAQAQTSRLCSTRLVCPGAWHAPARELLLLSAPVDRLRGTSAAACASRCRQAGSALPGSSATTHGALRHVSLLNFLVSNLDGLMLKCQVLCLLQGVQPQTSRPCSTRLKCHDAWHALARELPCACLQAVNMIKPDGQCFPPLARCACAFKQAVLHQARVPRRTRALAASWVEVQGS